MAIKDPFALLKRLCSTPETDWLEFKLNNVQPQEIGETICALANAAILQDRDRAYLVFGVEDGTRKRLGTNIKLGALKHGAEDFTNWLSRVLEPRVMIEPIDFSNNGLDFSILTVEPSYDRPVSFSGTEYIRIGHNVKKLREFPNHERSLWQATNRRKFEHSIAASNLKIEKVFSLLDVETFYRLSKVPLPQSGEEIVRKLCAEGIIVDDMEGGFHVTNLGAILLAKDITAFPSIRAKSVRITGYKGKNKKESDFEQEGQKGYAVGFEGMMRFIMQRIPRDERYIDGVRTIVPRVPEVAIREIIANALIHQDFTVTGSAPVIEVFLDRIEVINPGNSLILPDRMIDERRSRNEKLAAL